MNARAELIWAAVYAQSWQHGVSPTCGVVTDIERSRRALLDADRAVKAYEEAKVVE